MKRLLLHLVSFAFILGAAPSHGQEFRIAVEAIHYAPHYTTEDGTYQGFARELLDRFAAANGHRFTYVPLPLLRLYKQYLDDGQFDFKYPDNAYWHQEQRFGKKITYSLPVVSYSDGVMVRPNQLGEGVTRLRQLGTIRGFTPWEYLPLIKTGRVHILENNSLESLLKMTMADRVDGAYVNRDVANHQLKKTGRNKALVFDPTLPHTCDFYYLSTMKHPAIINQFNRFLVAEKDFITQLKRKYGLPTDEN